LITGLDVINIWKNVTLTWYRLSNVTVYSFYTLSPILHPIQGFFLLVLKSARLIEIQNIIHAYVNLII